METRNPANFKGNNGNQHLKTISCGPLSSRYSRQIFQFGSLVSRIQQVVATFIVDFQVRNVCCVDLAAVLVGEEGKGIMWWLKTTVCPWFLTASLLCLPFCRIYIRSLWHFWVTVAICIKCFGFFFFFCYIQYPWLQVISVYQLLLVPHYT